MDNAITYALYIRITANDTHPLDVNECFEGSTLHNCINAQCNNTDGSFECYCLPGYTKPGPPHVQNICEGIVIQFCCQ